MLHSPLTCHLLDIATRGYFPAIFAVTQGWVSCMALAWDAQREQSDPLGGRDAPGLCEMCPGTPPPRDIGSLVPPSPAGSHSQGADIAN